MTETTDIAVLMRDMRDLADRIVECQGENSNGEEIIHLYDQSDTTFKAQNILLVLNAFEAERQRAASLSKSEWKMAGELSEAQAELAALKGEREEIEFDIEPEYFLPHCLKTDEISGEARTRRIKELIRWFGRYWHATANPKWFSAHTAELCYYIVSQKQLTSPQKPVVLPQRYSSASIAGQGITVKDTSGDLLDRLQVIAAIEAAGGIVVEPNFREISNSSTKHFRENAETSTNCPKCGGRGSYHCLQMCGTVECECGAVKTEDKHAKP